MPSNKLEDDRKGNKDTIANTNECSIKAIKESYICIYLWWQAGSIAVSAGTILATRISIKDSISWDNFIARVDIIHQRLCVVLAK